MRVWANTDKGLVRTDNEDWMYVGDTGWDGVFLLAVADGMGGHDMGEVASRLAVNTIVDRMQAVEANADQADELGAAIVAAHRAVLAEPCGDEIRRMGSTVTAALIDGSKLSIGHVGDSRAYMSSGGRLRQLTSDHTVVGELKRNGDITEAEAACHPHRNLLTRAIGIGGELTVDVVKATANPGDVLLLCTDGLTSVVTTEEISRILEQTGDPAEGLVRLAIERGGPDNVTVIVAVFDGGDGLRVVAS